LRNVHLCGAETCIMRKVDQKYMESFDMCFWKRMEKISWADRVRNEVLHRVEVEENTLNNIRRKKANRIGHALRRNCLIKETDERKIEGRVEVTERR